MLVWYFGKERLKNIFSFAQVIHRVKLPDFWYSVGMPIPSGTMTYDSCLLSLAGLNKVMDKQETADQFYQRFILFQEKKGRTVPEAFLQRIFSQCAVLIDRRRGITKKKIWKRPNTVFNTPWKWIKIADDHWAIVDA